jgi:hypothetical protein
VGENNKPCCGQIPRISEKAKFNEDKNKATFQGPSKGQVIEYLQ